MHQCNYVYVFLCLKVLVHYICQFVRKLVLVGQCFIVLQKFIAIMLTAIVMWTFNKMSLLCVLYCSTVKNKSVNWSYQCAEPCWQSSHCNPNDDPSPNLWPFDLRLSACLGPVVDNIHTTTLELIAQDVFPSEREWSNKKLTGATICRSHPHYFLGILTGYNGTYGSTFIRSVILVNC